MRYIFLYAIIGLLLFTGCQTEKEQTQPEPADGQAEEQMNEEVTEQKGEVLKITAEEAYKIMSENEDIIILDVRTEEEFNSGHIKNAVLLPHTDIKNKVEEVIPDKNQTILVYCRSGNRSSIASQELLELGYTDIRDFGGIIDWPYEIVD